MMAKKWFKTALAAVLAIALALGAAACNPRWNGNVTLKEPGAVTSGSNGGFVVETENYVYFVNGEEMYTADNALGTPVKGALMVADKSKLGTEELRAEIVVPKLFAAGDTGAGVYLFGERIYFASPSTEKDTSGNAANDHLDFCSMRYDGTDFQKYFTINGNTTQYRFMQTADGNVHAVYYDSAEKDLIDYDVTAGTSSAANAAGDVSAYTFLPNEAVEKTGIVAFYTVVPKNAETNTDETFNELYAYKVGEESKLIVSGKRTDTDGNPAGAPAATYAVSFFSGSYAFLTETRKYDADVVKTYGADVADLYEKGLSAAVKDDSAKEYKDTTAIASASVFGSLTEVYAVDGDYIVRYDYDNSKNDIGTYTSVKTTVAKAKATKLLTLSGNDIYYVNGNTELAKIAVSGDGAGDAAEEIRVSAGAIVSDWFNPEIAAGNIFWLDAANTGLSYVNYAALDGETVAEDTDDDDEDDLWYIKDTFFLGVRKDTDKTQYVTLKIAALSTDISQIEYDRDAADGEKWTQEKQIVEARAAYEALSDELKKNVSEADVKILERYENYLKISKMLFGDGEEEGLAEFQEFEEGGYRIVSKEVTEENMDRFQSKIDEIVNLMKELDYTSSDKGMLVQGGMGVLQAMQAQIDELKGN